MERATQLTVCLPNKPGMLAKVCRLLADAKVNLLAVSVVDAREACLLRLVPNDAKVAARALEAHGFKSVPTSVRLMDLPNKVGALAEMAERLHERKVNVNFLYGSTGPRGNVTLVMEAQSTK